MNVPINPKALKIFRENLVKIEDNLAKLITHTDHSEETLTICLKNVYKLITTEENPSSAASIIFKLFDETFIPKAISWLLKDSVTNDYDIRKGVNVLCTWVPMHIVPNLHLWISEILRGLKVNIYFL